MKVWEKLDGGPVYLPVSFGLTSSVVLTIGCSSWQVTDSIISGLGLHH